ncbi:cdsA [Wigglesworthia glossinidia endosymbiont of Glossina brevipalpis]|uniref:Phosphatidate cytidylyltransferase n=1 Tax=Wigglesworthia glossinidia brevipalpis TaxID=36870 RepID=Q8D2G8_WIGBR|nr:cdsA [Wigglesworthia glossinidia endosymbiont of Glossina brevipalpis]
MLLKIRLISTLFLFICIISILFYFNNNVFLYFIVAIFATSIWEWSNICKIKHNIYKILYLFSSISFFYLIIKCLERYSLTSLFEINIYLKYYFEISFICWMQFIIMTFFYPKFSYFWDKSVFIRTMSSYFIFFPFFITIILLYQYNLYSCNFGSWIIFYLITCICFADIGAYVFGKILGKHKLFLMVSPNKTLEGVIGGIFLSFISIYLFYKYKFFYVNKFIFFISSFISVFFGILGDLVMSMFKRKANIKDSGKIIPGHGGILDRIDSLSFSIPIFFYLIFFIFGNWS